MAKEDFIRYLKNNGESIIDDAKKLLKLEARLDDFHMNRRFDEFSPESRNVLRNEIKSQINVLESRLKKDILTAYADWCITQLGT